MKYGYLLARELDYQPDECILEIGSERNEGSTSFLDSLGVKFITVDPHPTVFTHYRMTGEDFLTDIFPKMEYKVKFAYLDGFDWEYPVFANPAHYEEQKQEYWLRGVELNNDNSQASHWKQTALLLPFLTEDAIIAYDDTWRESTAKGRRWTGKGGKAVPQLFLQGFKLYEEGDKWTALSRHKPKLQ